VHASRKRANSRSAAPRRRSWAPPPPPFAAARCRHLHIAESRFWGLKVRVRDAEAAQVAEGRGELRQGQDHLEDTKHTQNALTKNKI
jgi:hypothetical protein